MGWVSFLGNNFSGEVWCGCRRHALPTREAWLMRGELKECHYWLYGHPAF